MKADVEWLRSSGADADGSDKFSESDKVPARIRGLLGLSVTEEPLALPFGRIKEDATPLPFESGSLLDPCSDGASEALLPLPVATLRTIRAPYADLSVSSLEDSDAVDRLVSSIEWFGLRVSSELLGES